MCSQRQLAKLVVISRHGGSGLRRKIMKFSPSKSFEFLPSAWLARLHGDRIFCDSTRTESLQRGRRRALVSTLIYTMGWETKYLFRSFYFNGRRRCKTRRDFGKVLRTFYFKTVPHNLKAGQLHERNRKRDRQLNRTYEVFMNYIAENFDFGR